jgi:ferric-dicitrate binding protein FerR (iron transport regulator)
VELSGEAYFEVQRQAGTPFRIVSLQQEIEVLGTRFNVHAYPDEAHIKTTLVDGSVRVTAGANSVLLKPDQQSDLSDKLRVSPADVQAAIAWKNGFFRYQEERLEIIMKHVARWYNVKVEFEDEKLKNEGFGILSTRFANISSFLQNLARTGDGSVKFSVSGSTVFISRKK